MSENRKMALLLVVGALIVGGTFAAQATPRQRRQVLPYLPWAGVALVGMAVLAVAVVLSRRAAANRRREAMNRAVAEGETWLLLRPKEAKAVDVEKVTLWKRLAYAQPTGEHFSFEAYGNGEKQGLAVHASQTKARAVLREFLQEWPDVQRRPAGETDPATVPDGWHLHWVEVGPSSAEKPISISSRDPLLAALSEMADTPGPTRTIVQVIARSDTNTRHQLGQRSAALRAEEVQNAGVRYQRTKEARLLEERGARLFLQVVVRVAAISPDPQRAAGAARALANTLCHQFGPDNPVVILAEANPKRSIDLLARSIDGGAARSWADDEIVALAHLPGGDALKFAPLLSTGSAKALPARPDLYLPKKARLPRLQM